MEAPLSTESLWPEYDGGALRDALVRASHQLTRRRRRRRFVALAALLATGAIATGVGASGWLAHDVTPAELEQTATVVENDVYLDCGSVVLGCVQKTATHRQVDITPNAGPVPNAVSFALPDGTQVAILPASGVGPALPTHPGPTALAYGLPGIDENGHFHSGTIHREGDSVMWSFALPDGTTRTVRWWRDTGRIQMTKREAGRATTIQLHAGDVVEIAG